MLSTVHIENYGCIRNLDLRLGKLTALVGPNSSGKSTVLRVLNQHVDVSRAVTWRHEPIPVSLTSIDVDGAKRSASTAGSQTLAWHTRRYQLARLDVDRLRDENTVAAAKTLDMDGNNLANVFGTLTRKQQEALAVELKKLVPVFDDVDLTPTGGGRHELRFKDRWASDLWYRPNEVSDGTVMMLAYLVLRHQTPTPQLLCIEEPDRGLHPYLLEQLVALLRGMSEGADGKEPVQIVLATHSADLLDHLRPEEVRFLSRDPKDGGVTVEQVDVSAPDWKSAFAEYKESLGNVWLSGGVGGVP